MNKTMTFKVIENDKKRYILNDFLNENYISGKWEFVPIESIDFYGKDGWCDLSYQNVTLHPNFYNKEDNRIKSIYMECEGHDVDCIIFSHEDDKWIDKIEITVYEGR